MDIPFDPEREQNELALYLGPQFELERLWRYQEQLDAELAGAENEASFYRTSEAYLYNLTAFAMTGTKLPYLRELIRVVAPGARVLDYGCGIGSDGLMLLERGFRVEFADYDNPSTAYLRWRLRRRGYEAPVHDLDAGVPSGFEAAFAFDVIEHVADPFALLEELERRAGLVVVNLLGPAPDDQPSHRRLPIHALLYHASTRRLRSYRLLHGRSHLVIYESRPATPAGRVANLSRLAAGRLRRARVRRGTQAATTTPCGSPSQPTSIS
jgi:SAM-dependent methyltransferase